MYRTVCFELQKNKTYLPEMISSFCWDDLQQIKVFNKINKNKNYFYFVLWSTKMIWDYFFPHFKQRCTYLCAEISTKIILIFFIFTAACCLRSYFFLCFVHVILKKHLFFAVYLFLIKKCLFLRLLFCFTYKFFSGWFFCVFVLEK